MKHGLSLKLLVFLLLAAATTARSTEFFVSPTGSDGDPGTIEKPFATFRRTQDAAGQGDTIHVRGGTYVMSEAQVARRKAIFAYATLLDKGGEPDRWINCWSDQDERPVFDFSAVKPAGARVDAFYVAGSWLHIKGLEVVGVQVTLKGHTQSIAFENDRSHNIYERPSVHDGQAIGIYSVRGSDNLSSTATPIPTATSRPRGPRGPTSTASAVTRRKAARGTYSAVAGPGSRVTTGTTASVRASR